MKKVRVKDIVEKTGYARSTIYAALKNNPRIGKETTELIQQTAAEMDYSIDPVYSELGHRRWKDTPSNSGENIIFFTNETCLESQVEELSRIKKYAQEKGYHITVCTTSQFKSIDQANRTFRAQGVRGIGASFISYQESAEFIDHLDLDRIAVISNEANRNIFHSIAWNWAEMASQALRSLLERGYKNIPILF